MDLMARHRMLESMPPNLYTGSNNLDAGRMTTLNISLPPGVYVFSAAITSTDTDSATSAVRFMQENDTDATTEDDRTSQMQRSVSGESHSMVYHVIANVHHVYLYASSNWPKGSGDTSTYKNIRIWRIG